MSRACTLEGEIARKNRELYDETSGPVWQLAVYEPVHGGWEFINLGGRAILDELAGRAGLGPGDSVVELCSGQGATCRYLAGRYGCDVTGVEMNPRQVERARRRLGEEAPGVAARVRFVESDVLAWRPERAFDAALSIDSMMLIGDVPGALANAHAALRPGGRLLVVTIAAGPRVDEELRRLAWETDGMISLLAAEEHARMMREAGFEGVETEDFTPLAVESSQKMAAALEGRRDELVRAEGEEGYRGWRELGLVYLDAFRDRKLTYQLVGGRRRA
jgi:sarcosine/dimethylglycine N-methyltransferase